MSAPRRPRAREIFEAALERAPEDRLEHVYRACGEDTALSRVVTRLLENDEAAGAQDYLERPVITPSERPGPKLESSAISGSERIGDYELLGRVAEGGTSSVYLAQGRAGQPAEVAIKVLRAGLRGPRALRSHREGATLSRLDHALIPRVLDSGSTSTGRPFFVMEFVDGEPITEYCDRYRLPPPARIELFLEVCEAVAHAHQHLVVHRDLKPTNILVDSTGTPRLLDFGIAKWLELEAPDGASTTTAERVLTPNYAAPEQFLGGTITTSTDVYSLGVLLYELLSGTRPYCWHGLPIPTILDSWERERPTPPSATFADPAPAGTSILCADTRAEYRSSTGGALCRRLSGDLDNIVLMALRFEPHRRYGSVPALVEDLQRFLDGRVVRARPSTWSYRLGKFVRRNALVVSQTALVFALVLLFAVRTLLESRRVAHERNVAEEQRRAAVRERATTEAVTDLLLEAYRVTDPYRGQGQTLRAEEVLARGAQLAESTLTEAPHVRAQVEHTLGRLYLNLGLFERAEGHLQRALALGDAVYGVDSVETAAVRATVADVFLSRNDFESAERAIRQAIQVLRDRGSDQEPTLGSYRRLLARVLTERGRFTDAELLARQALVSHRRGGDRLEAEVALDLNTLLEVQVWRGDHEAALASGNEAVEKSRRAFPAGSVAQAESLAGRGISLWNLRRFDEAMQDMNEAMALAEGSLGDQHPSVAAISGNLGLFHLSQGDLAAAEPLLRRAIATFRANFDRPHSALLRSQSNLARVLMQSGRARAAVALLEECVVGYRELYGDDHPLEAEALQHLGSTYYIDGQLDQAASALAQALLIRQRSGIADRTTEGANRVLLARVERERGQPLSARRHLGAALEIFARLEGDLGAWLAAIGEMRLAEVFVDLGRIDEAEALIERSMAAFSKVDDDPDHQAKRTECRGILGRILAARGRLFEAEAELAGSLEELRAASWTSAEQQAEGARRLVEFYEAQGRSSEASAYRSLSVRRPSFE